MRMELKKIQFSQVISNKKKYWLRDQGLNKINLKKNQMRMKLKKFNSHKLFQIKEISTKRLGTK
jgi:predicted metal-binding transcription factor (methanogenesis marker protein 9)